jgi:thiamine biosynthesis lipoprotein
VTTSLLLSVAIGRAAEQIALSGRAMGTEWSVTFEQPGSPLERARVQRQVADRLEALEQQFSTYRPHSIISRFNAARHTAWFPIDREMVEVATMSRAVSELGGGAFDVTVHPLVQLWGFGVTRRRNCLPSAPEIAAAREFVDWRQLDVRMSPPALRKARPQVAVDFSSMAKGFAADEVSDLLGRLGAPNHLVRIGGDLKSGGSKRSSNGWRTGIELPSSESRGLACVVVLRGHALSTSGDYRNFFEAGGRRFGHIIDPRTGEPVAGTLASVSVIHASGAMSSALATALFVLGLDDGYRLAREQQLACLFQWRDGAEMAWRATPEFEALIVKRDSL